MRKDPWSTSYQTHLSTSMCGYFTETIARKRGEIRRITFSCWALLRLNVNCADGAGFHVSFRVKNKYADLDTIRRTLERGFSVCLRDSRFHGSAESQQRSTHCFERHSKLHRGRGIKADQGYCSELVGCLMLSPSA